jgi:hypothetical protein
MMVPSISSFILSQNLLIVYPDLRPQQCGLSPGPELEILLEPEIWPGELYRHSFSRTLLALEQRRPKGESINFQKVGCAEEVRQSFPAQAATSPAL